MQDATPSKKSPKISIAIILFALVVLPLIVAIVAFVIPFAAVIIIVNMIYNKGRINFKPRPVIKPKRKQPKPFIYGFQNEN